MRIGVDGGASAVPGEEQKQESTERGYCATSPTRARRWILEGPSRIMHGECKYCHFERAVRPFKVSVGFGNSRGRRCAGA